MPDGYCDCDGNVLDCADECGGSAIEDACGLCDGDGSSCSSSGSWTTLDADGGDRQITLMWADPYGARIGVDSSDDRGSNAVCGDGVCNSSEDETTCPEDCSGCTSGVCLSIENVDTDAGTLDIYMTTQDGCSYCTDNNYSNDQEGCLDFGDDGWGLDASWVFNRDMDENACNEVNGIFFIHISIKNPRSI
jgi:hypothetical protein